MNKIIFGLLLIFLGATQSQAARGVNIQDRLETQKVFFDTYPAVFGEKNASLIKSFADEVSKLSANRRVEVNNFLKSLDRNVPQKILLPITYWKLVNPNYDNLKKVLLYYMVYRITVLRDFIDHPVHGTASEKQNALAQMRRLLEDSEVDSLNWFARKKAALEVKAGQFSQQDSGSLKGILRSDPIFKEKLVGNLDYSLSYLGFIPGNKTQLISKNDVSKSRIDWFNERVIFAGGKLDFTKPYMKMPEKVGDDGHIAFKEDPMFQKIRDMVRDAKDSIFIDIFLFGGTMGATLAKYVVDKTLEKRKTNPVFKTLILHDYATNYNMKSEMMPIFEYILGRIKNESAVNKSVYLLQANIQRHPPGIPFGVTNLVPKTDEVFKFIEQRNTYFESKIDHSKVIVVDANTEFPKAYFGSKNWSDHSGGYYYDDAIYLEGPAAALVQASYWDDVDAALTQDKKERKWFFFKEQGFDNKRYDSRRDEILHWMKVKRTHYPAHKDGQWVRLAEANVDGKIKNARNMIIDMISKAEKNIFMEHLFIYDYYINDALIKRKLEKPSLDIRIIADHNHNFGLNGLPNTLFMDELRHYGIKIRAHKTLGSTAKFPDGTSQTYHQENHRKVTSVDGKILLGGSSNLNADTLQGSFREFGAQIFNVAEVKKFEERFEKYWDNDSQVGPIESKKLKVLGKDLTPQESQFLNSLGSMILRAKDSLEQRF